MEPMGYIPDLAGQPAPSAQGTILVADDEPAVRLVVKGMLECMGFAVLTAGDGRQAVQAFADHADEIDAVLLDLTMPGLSGEQALDELRRIRPRAKVVLCSGFGEAEMAQRFGARSQAAFLQKPFDYDTLAAKLKSLLRGI